MSTSKAEIKSLKIKLAIARKYKSAYLDLLEYYFDLTGELKNLQYELKERNQKLSELIEKSQYYSKEKKSKGRRRKTIKNKK